MPKYIPVALLIVCALALAFVLGDSSQNQPSRSSARTAELALDSADSLSLPPPLDTSASASVIERDSLPYAPEPQDASSSSKDGVRVRTILADGSPLANATVDWVHLDEVEQNPEAAPFLTAEPDLLALAKRFGKTTATNAEGYAYLPTLVEHTDILGSKDGLFDSWWYRGEADITLVLEKNRSLRVRAISSSGQPVPSIDIGIFKLFTNDEELYWPEVTARTNDAGYATLERFELGFSIRDKTAAVAVIGLFPNQIRAKINFQNLSTTPVELELPPFASVALNLKGADDYPPLERRRCGLVIDPNPTPGRTLEQLREAYESSESWELYSLLWSDTAVFDCIGLNQSFLAEVRGVDPLNSTLIAFEGPTQAGERLNIEIRPLAKEKHIKMLVLSDGNKPLRSRTLSVELHQIGYDEMRSRSLDRRFRLTADEDGELDFEQHGDFFLNYKHLKSVAIRIALMEENLAESLVGEIEIDPLCLDDSDDLPPLRLHRQDLLVAGKIIGWPKKKLRGIELRIEHHPDMTTTTPPTWSGWEELDSVFTDETGNFFAPFPAVPPSGHLRLRPPSFETPLQIVKFQAGETGVQVDLSSHLSLSGTIIPPEGMELKDLISAFVPTPGAVAQWAAEYGRIEPDLTFQLDSLSPETGMFQILGRPGNLPLITIENVAAHKFGQASDPRLNPVDLRHSVNYFEIQVVDATNDFIPGVYLRGINKDHNLWSTNPREGLWKVPSGDSTIEALLWAEGFALQPVLLLPGLNNFTLQKGLPVRLTVEGVQELPDGFFSLIELNPASNTNRPFRSGEQIVPASGVVDFDLATPDTYIWSIKVMRGADYITGYFMTDLEDQLQVIDSSIQQNFTVTLPLKEILSDLKRN